eukprot:maker-scaffold13_size735724-snap-gene-3.12 protein:Tk03460 transcript:maker-scaffold13_size735724-snap-gene-3.12-mRNA-1 annotation:"protein-methionine-s-oxide reductase"
MALGLGLVVGTLILIFTGLGVILESPKAGPEVERPRLQPDALRQLAFEDPKALGLEEWKQILEPSVFQVTRKLATEPPFSSRLNDITNKSGVFQCSNCGQNVFHAKHKFESGTGWPSFFDVLPDAIGQDTDFKIGYARTEIHCQRCGAHLGHVFKDGPPPTGLRYCMNGLALLYDPRDT